MSAAYEKNKKEKKTALLNYLHCQMNNVRRLTKYYYIINIIFFLWFNMKMREYEWIRITESVLTKTIKN